MVERLVEQRKAVQIYFLRHDQTEARDLTANEWKMLEELILLLEPADASTRDFCKDDCHFGLQIAISRMLLREVNEGAVPSLLNEKCLLVEKIESRFEMLGYEKNYGLALFLDPRFKDRCFEGENQFRSMVKQWLVSEYQPMEEPVEEQVQPIDVKAKDSTESFGKLKSNASYSRQSSSEAADRKKRLTMPLIYRMYESVSEDLRGTINGPDDDDFRPEEASKKLREALSGGIQSNDKAIINILLAHNNFQRQKIAAAYEGMYNRTLSGDIEEEAGGFFLDAVLALVQPAHLYSARMLYHSISGRTYSRSTAVEIALTSSASQLKVIRDAYQAEFRVSLERDLNLKVEGLFGKMLLQLLLRSKDFDEEVDLEWADEQVFLLNAPENASMEEIGRNLDLFNKLFGAQGLNQIRTFLEKYDAQAMHGDADVRGKDFESLIRKSVSLHSDVRQMILLFVRISRNMQLYFAEKLFEAISGARPDHSSIIRILVSRSEIDLVDICSEYRRRYDIILCMIYKALAAETSYVCLTN
uniref:Annexin n=1 Tax=Ditylenchus dipsaci TaxID=166011 RepID=A0A915D1U5_9BILA